MQKTSHILSGAASLLGITLAVIAGMKVASASAKTYGDEVGWLAALCFATACALSYLSIRTETEGGRWERLADIVFITGLVALIAAVGVLSASNLG